MTKNFAHRGFSGKYPENTLLASAKPLKKEWTVLRMMSI